MTGRRLALLIAVDTYTNPGLRQLRAPSVDAEKLAEVLRDETLGGFTVAISSNQTAQAIAERIEDLLADLGADDTALVHFAGHGLRSDEGELYLAGQNTRPERLSTTGVDMRLVSRLIRRSRAGSVILLLDCCYGAAFAKGVVARAGDKIDISSSFPLDELPRGRGHVVITAARETEFAVESGGVVDSAYRGSSLFTAALIQGIASGEADADGDGLISVNELYEFVYKQVRAARPQQTPNKWEFGVRGGLFISYSPRRRVRPAPLPAYVAELVNSDKYTFHQVAVQELLHLVEGDDVALAAAARAALRDSPTTTAAKSPLPRSPPSTARRSGSWPPRSTSASWAAGPAAAWPRSRSRAARSPSRPRSSRAPAFAPASSTTSSGWRSPSHGPARSTRSCG